MTKHDLDYYILSIKFYETVIVNFGFKKNICNNLFDNDWSEDFYDDTILGESEMNRGVDYQPTKK